MKFMYLQKHYLTLRNFTIILLLTLFGVLSTGCEPTVQPVYEKSSTVVDTVVKTINLTSALDTTVNTEPEYIEEPESVVLGDAQFFADSFVVTGEGYSFHKKTDYSVIRIIFDDDGKIKKTEYLTDLPFTRIDENTIFIKRGANLTTIARYFKVPVSKLLECNPRVKDPNKLPALSRLKINCQ